MRLIRILLFLIWLASSIGVSLQTNSSNSFSTSTLRPPVERVFSRKKRWMLFPRGTALKFTMSISKRLLAVYPRGFNFNLEAAAYYPMPTSRIDLIPKRLRPTTTKKPKPKGPTPLNLIGIPGSLLKFRARPATRAPIVQRVDANSSALQWLSSPASASSPSYSLYNNSEKWSKWSKYGSPEYLKNYQWSPEKQHKYVDKYSNRKWSKWSPNSGKTQPYKTNAYNNEWIHGGRYGRDIDKSDYFQQFNDHENFEFEPMYFDDLEPFEESLHYHAHRGRRELFHHFEGLTKLLGIDMKSCILRAMCDSKRFLLPPGYSMIQDILRVIFTFPTISGLKDDYSRIMETDYQTCDAFMHNKCPFSLVDLLLNSKKPL